MLFQNRLKAGVTQALVRSLLVDAGISVVPLGVEEVVREVAELDKERYLKLGIPPQLRSLPDFLAVSADRSRSWLLEVKFRRTWDSGIQKELEAYLEPQVRAWDPLFLILFFGVSPGNYGHDLPAAWVRTAKLSMHNGVLCMLKSKCEPLPWRNIKWNDMDRMQDVFPELNTDAKWDARVLPLITDVAKHLSTL